MLLCIQQQVSRGLPVYKLVAGTSVRGNRQCSRASVFFLKLQRGGLTYVREYIGSSSGAFDKPARAV
jgi:hypothetical protein